MIFLIFFLFTILPDSIAFSQSYEYFSFAPFTENYLDLSLVKSIEQNLKIYDDNLYSIGIWIKNDVEESKIKVSLYKENYLITSKVFNIPLLLYPTKFALSLGNNYKIGSGANYKIKIEHISGRGLKIFYSNIIQLQQHTEEYSLTEDIVGSLIINNNTTSLALNFTLNENEESDLPQIKNVQIQTIDPYKTIIYFQTNENTKYKIIYWTSDMKEIKETNFTDYLEKCYKPNRCKFEISTKPNTLYIFQIGVQDYWGNLNAYQGSFLTPIDPNIQTATASTPTPIYTDKEPPILTYFNIEELTTTSITVKFTTNEYTIATFDVYTTTSKLVLTKKSPIFNNLHILSTKNVLAPFYYYYGIIKIEDMSNNINQFKFHFNTYPRTKITTTSETSTKLENISLSTISTTSLPQSTEVYSKSQKEGPKVRPEENKLPITTTTQESKTPQEIIIFDNLTNKLSLSLSKEQLPQFILEIYDKYGNLIKKIENIKENQIFLKDLKKGEYEFILRRKDNKEIIAKKNIKIPFDYKEGKYVKYYFSKKIFHILIISILLVLFIYVLYKSIKRK